MGGRRVFFIAFGTLFLSTVFLSIVLFSAPLRRSGGERVADSLLARVGITRGVCAILGSDTVWIARGVLDKTAFFVHLQDPDPATADSARRLLDGPGLLGKRVFVDRAPLTPLPYADNMIDVVLVILGTTPELKYDLSAVSAREILRVLRPGGKAVVGYLKDSGGRLKPAEWQKWLEAGGLGGYVPCSEDLSGSWGVLTKPRPEGMDSWSHWEHGPDNNPVSRDTVIKAPYRTQWIGGPLYSAMPAVTTAAGGRIFTAMGHIAHHRREEKWLNTLLARNGYNGAILWTRKLPDGYLVHRSAFVATDDVFYLIDYDGCLMLDPETGRELGRISVPEVEGEWKYISLKDGVLYFLAGKKPDPAETTVVRSPYTHWSWGELSEGYYRKTIPWGFGTTLGAVDLKTKKLLWRYRERRGIDSRSLVLGGGKFYFYCPGVYTACVDAERGRLRWRNYNKKTMRLIEEPGRGLRSTPGFRTTCYALWSPKAVFFQAQTRMNVVAISTDKGRFLWSRKKTTNNPNMLFVDGQLIVGIGPNGSTLVLDPLTGETIEDLGFAKRSCARLTATHDSFFCRGMPEGLTRYDRVNRKVLFNGALRPACNDGVIPANGLLYIGPWLCDCNLSLMGTNALCSAGDFSLEKDDPPSGRLEIVKPAGGVASFSEVTSSDWPTYRGSAKRSAATTAAVGRSDRPTWVFEPGYAFRPTAPVACGNLVFLGGDDGKVRALEARSGRLIWSYATSGPIGEAPTVWRDRVYVGSGDGWLYVLEAATGKLLWRFRLAPFERRIMLFGKLCSNWPVASGVLVEEGTAYAAAGIIDYDGTSVCALDAVSGKLKWRNVECGHLDPVLRKGVSAQGILTTAQGRLWMPGGNVISPAVFDLADGRCLSRSVGNGSPRANRGQEIGVLADRYLIFGGRLKYSAVRNYVNPGVFAIARIEKGKIVRAATLCRGKIPPAWTDEFVVMANGRNTVPVCATSADIDRYVTEAAAARARRGLRRPHALKKKWRAEELKGSDAVAFVVAANCVLVAGESPGFRSRFSNWYLWALDRETGKVLWKERLPGPVIPGAVAVTRQGKVLAALEDGRIVCCN